MYTTIRFLCEVRGDAISLISRERIDMLTGASDPADTFKNRIGCWVEVRDVQGAPLFRQVMRDPIRPHVEVFAAPGGDKAERSIAMLPRPAGHEQLVLLAPELPDADHIALVRAAPTPDGGGISVVDVARFPMKGSTDTTGSVVGDAGRLER